MRLHQAVSHNFVHAANLQVCLHGAKCTSCINGIHAKHIRCVVTTAEKRICLMPDRFPDQTLLVPATLACPVPFLLSAHANRDMTLYLQVSKEDDSWLGPRGFSLYFCLAVWVRGRSRRPCLMKP
jgi:hypothetical protein